MAYGAREYGTGSYKYGEEESPSSAPVTTTEDLESPEDGIDLMIGLDDNDLTISNGDLVLTSGERLVRQDLQVNTLLFYGECAFNNKLGINFFDDVCTKSPNLNSIKAIFKNIILSVWKVEKLVDFRADFNPQTRRLDIRFQVDTSFGPISYTVPQ